jgi:hypothetical protein
MNRIQFLTVTGLSGLVALLLLLQIVFVKMEQADQLRLMERNQIVSQGQACQNSLKQLVLRIYQVSQQTQDPSLKDLLARHQISITPNQAQGADSTGSSPSPTH